MNVSPRPRSAEISSAADVGWKSSGRSNLTTSSVIAKAKTPSAKESSRLFETNSLGSAISSLRRYGSWRGTRTFGGVGQCGVAFPSGTAQRGFVTLGLLLLATLILILTH